MRDLATGRLRLDRLAAMATPRLSSPGLRPFLAETRKSLPCHPALRSGPDGCVVDRLRPLDRHRDRDGRGLGQPGRNHMATIGTFEHIGDSEYLGDIFTLSLRAKNVRIVSVSRTNENAPSHRIYVDQVDAKVEVGAGWSKRSPEGRDYLSVKLDDPSFNAPIFANLVHDEGAETCSLIWSRPNRRQGDG
jgi:uncharacterized protein (DUF736 family)